MTCVVRGCPKGLGTPVFDKLEAELAKAMLSLPATKVCMRGCDCGAMPCTTCLCSASTLLWLVAVGCAVLLPSTVLLLVL